MDDDALAAFQAVWLELLDQQLPPEALRAAVLARPEAAPFRAWVQEADPRSLELAAVLVRKWGQRGAE